jgi:hypothetical protein
VGDRDMAHGEGDLGKAVIKTRTVTAWQANWSASGPGEPGAYIFQLVLDQCASEVVLTLTEDDADNLFDWLTASDEVMEHRWVGKAVDAIAHLRVAPPLHGWVTNIKAEARSSA